MSENEHELCTRCDKKWECYGACKEVKATMKYIRKAGDTDYSYKAKYQEKQNQKGNYNDHLY